MTKEQAINYLRSSGFSSEQIKEIVKALEQEPILNKIRAEINQQEKWLLQAGYTAYNVDIAFDTINAILAESENKKCI
jgi:DNA-binding transcriptional MerR regulator